MKLSRRDALKVGGLAAVGAAGLNHGEPDDNEPIWADPARADN